MKEFNIITDKEKMDFNYIHKYLSEKSYWAKGRSKADVIKSINNSLCFAVMNGENNQVGFARVATDFVVFSWLMDVFIDEAYRGKGLGKMLMEFINNYPELKKVNGFGLKTKDTHSFYEKFGFKKINDPEVWMFKKNIK